jgi:hypothetical protein
VALITFVSAFQKSLLISHQMLRMRLSETATQTTGFAIERWPMKACDVLVSISRAASA